jgi:hypothetical protein
MNYINRNTYKPMLIMYLAGAALALATGLGDLGKVLTAGSYVSVPGPLAVVQLVAAWRAPRSRAATVVLALSMSLSVAAILFDGDLGHAGLSTVQAVFQTTLAAVIVCVAGLAWAALVPRREASAA